MKSVKVLQTGTFQSVTKIVGNLGKQNRKRGKQALDINSTML